MGLEIVEHVDDSVMGGEGEREAGNYVFLQRVNPIT